MTQRIAGKCGGDQQSNDSEFCEFLSFAKETCRVTKKTWKKDLTVTVKIDS
jgi:hypothetical protein